LVTIAGTNFGSAQGGSTVTFNGTAATPANWSASSIEAPVPAGAASGDVVVTVNGTASNGVQFLVLQVGAGTIPNTFWGLIINQLTSYPLQVPYGQFRGWDSGGREWPEIESCQASSGDWHDPCFDWTTLDEQMADLMANGVNDVMYTLSRTPKWAVDLNSDPTGEAGTGCNYYRSGETRSGAAPGQCLPPVDLNADGSGQDEIWKNWVTAIATHVNDPTYLQTHAHVKYWEPWNEFNRSTVLAPGFSGELSFEGTYAQLVRLTEDSRCVITGTGTIHNDPSAGQSTPCTASPIDSSAVIVSPSSGTGLPQELNVMQNFLYCNGTGVHAPAPGSDCSTGNAGSQAVDIINFHLYAGAVTPEEVVNTQLPKGRAILQPADLNKPMVSGEGSWADPSKPGNLWSDPYAQAGFIPRFFALYWSAGLTMNIWYSYDTTVGELYDRSAGTLSQPAATAWKSTYNWLVGAKPVYNPFCNHNGTVYACDFTEANGATAELVWDAQYGQNCSSMSNPTICGATNYNVPAQFNKDWIDVTGSVHSSSSTVTIGANPILLEGN